MKAKSILVVLAYLVLSVTVHADITVFDGNSIIADGDTYDTVVVRGDGTVVTMTGGTVTKLITMNNSTFNMTGSSAAITSRVHSYDTSTLNLSSGSVFFLSAFDNSNVNYSGNINSENSYHEFYDSTKVTVSDNANLSGSQFICRDNSSANIEGGTIMALRVGHDAHSARIIVSHCLISEIQVHKNLPVGNIEIGIVGYNLNANPYDGYGAGEVTGFWNDDTPFAINLGGEGTYPHIALYDGTLPPEPLPPLQDQITTLQEANAALLLQIQALEQQNALLQQAIDDNRYLLEQLPQLRKELEELQTIVLSGEATTSNTLKTDVTGDNTVNFADFAVMASEWLH